MIPDILIVDDEPIARLHLKMLLTEIEQQWPLRLLGIANNGAEALAMQARHPADIILLDVQMAGQDGLQTARELRQQRNPPAIIFVTAHDQFAIRAFELEACDYLLKPVGLNRLRQALQRACESRSAQAQSAGRSGVVGRPGFSVSDKGGKIFVPLQQVLCVQAEQKYLSLYTDGQMYLLEASLAGLERQFPDYFVRIHRNTLVARQAISGVVRTVPGSATGQWQLRLHGLNRNFAISRRRWTQLRQLLRLIDSAAAQPG